MKLINHWKVNNNILRKDAKVSGYYYLHSNGDLIYKREGFFDSKDCDSNFVEAIWPIDLSDRTCAWLMLIEAGSLKADENRLDELILLWGINDKDAPNFAEVLEDILLLKKIGDRWITTFRSNIYSNYSDFLDPELRTLGFGKTAFEALIDLATESNERFCQGRTD